MKYSREELATCLEIALDPNNYDPANNYLVYMHTPENLFFLDHPMACMYAAKHGMPICFVDGSPEEKVVLENATKYGIDVIYDHPDMSNPVVVMFALAAAAVYGEKA